MRPSIVVALVTATLLLRAGVASADARPVTSWAASHDGTVEGDRITWRTTYVGNDAPGAGDTIHVVLAAPLRCSPDDVRASHLVRVEQHGGAITGLEIEEYAGWRDAIVVTVVQRFEKRDAVTLTPPLARGDTVQVVTVTGGDDLRFEPSRATELVRHVGFLAPDEIDHAARTQCDDLLGRRFAASATPIYVRGTSRVAAEGLTGALTTSDERSRPGLVGAAFAFFAIGVGLVLLYRRLNGQARAEQAEAAIREEFASVERAAGGRAG